MIDALILTFVLLVFVVGLAVIAQNLVDKD